MKNYYNRINNKHIFSGKIVDVIRNKIYSGVIEVENKRIVKIIENNDNYENYIIPGFIDSHIHIESSMLPPSEFAQIAVKHGTIAAVCDAHEMANVLGIDGIKFMLNNAKDTPMKFFFSAPSCVPATEFETSGARIDVKEIESLFRNYPEIKFLGEMMNYPGVINNNQNVYEKIRIAQKYNYVIDGHSPGLQGDDLIKYISAGISTDHECMSKEEALEKISLGMKVQIREGSAARNFDDLISIVHEHHQNCMFCSDDKHPDDLVKSHINDLVRRGIKLGIDPLKVLQVSSMNPIQHYKLDVGLLQENDLADFLVIDNFNEMNILSTVVNGTIVASGGETVKTSKTTKVINKFVAEPKSVKDFEIQTDKDEINIIEIIPGQLFTKNIKVKPKLNKNETVSDIENDILKIVVINRYENTNPSVAFIKGFGLKKGAIASSVAHDSHNIIAVGVSDEDICNAVNMVITDKGGICAVDRQMSSILSLPIAGLMSDKPYNYVANKYSELDMLVKAFGSKLEAPYMTLSFMALLVIPELKISDKGLFDGSKFKFINLN
jgi:adenine deaminase